MWLLVCKTCLLPFVVSKVRAAKTQGGLRITCPVCKGNRIYGPSEFHAGEADVERSQRKPVSRAPAPHTIVRKLHGKGDHRI